MIDYVNDDKVELNKLKIGLMEKHFNNTMSNEKLFEKLDNKTKKKMEQQASLDLQMKKLKKKKFWMKHEFNMRYDGMIDRYLNVGFLIIL